MEIKHDYTRSRKNSGVHENMINTAPGLEGTTIEAYKNAILGELNGN